MHYSGLLISETLHIGIQPVIVHNLKFSLTLVSKRKFFSDKQEFKGIVREYLQLALHICKILDGRILKLHEKVHAHVA